MSLVPFPRYYHISVKNWDIYLPTVLALSAPDRVFPAEFQVDRWYVRKCVAANSKPTS